MALIIDVIRVNDRPTLVRLEEKFGPFEIPIDEEPEDDPEFRFYRKLMQEKPRGCK